MLSASTQLLMLLLIVSTRSMDVQQLFRWHAQTAKPATLQHSTSSAVRLDGFAQAVLKSVLLSPALISSVRPN